MCLGCRVSRTRVSCQTGFGHFKVFIDGVCFSGFASVTELGANCNGRIESQVQTLSPAEHSSVFRGYWVMIGIFYNNYCNDF